MNVCLRITDVPDVKHGLRKYTEALAKVLKPVCALSLRTFFIRISIQYSELE